MKALRYSGAGGFNASPTPVLLRLAPMARYKRPTKAQTLSWRHARGRSQQRLLYRLSYSRPPSQRHFLR